MPFAAAKRSRRYHRSLRARVVRRKERMATVAATATMTTGRMPLRAAKKIGVTALPEAVEASELMIDTITVKKTPPKTRKNATPITMGTTVAAEPNLNPLATSW